MIRDQILSSGKRVLRLECDALAEAERRLDDHFVRAVELMVAARGRVIVSGVGKSGLIGSKIAATLTSTGTPATFLHATDSVHGDLGLVGQNDVAVLLSKSGESEEILTLLSHLKRFGVRIVSLTANRESTLARASDAALDAWVREEACPHDLAPTTSTTVALALGDALAVAILEQKGFKREDFARIHPGGMLGRKLLLKTSELMEKDRLPLVAPAATVREAVVLLASRRGIVLVHEAGRLVGVFTAGDLTRVMERDVTPYDLPLSAVMTRAPRVATASELASAVVYRMEQFGIMAMPVLNEEEHIVGIVHLHDLMRAGVV